MCKRVTMLYNRKLNEHCKSDIMQKNKNHDIKKKFYASEDTTDSPKWQPENRKKIFSNHICDQGLISRFFIQRSF